MTNTATLWLQGLAARGVRATIRNNRLCLHPASAYQSLSDAEVLTLRHHRDEIKAAIAAGVSVDVCVPTETPAKTPEPPCRFCGRACVGPEHFAYALLHHQDPSEIERRRREATAEMMACVGRPHRAWDGLL